MLVAILVQFTKCRYWETHQKKLKFICYCPIRDCTWSINCIAFIPAKTAALVVLITVLRMNFGVLAISETVLESLSPTLFKCWLSTFTADWRCRWPCDVVTLYVWRLIASYFETVGLVWYIIHKILLPPPRRLFNCRCLFVCLSVCLPISNFAQKLPNGFAWKFSGKVGNGPVNNGLNFGGDPGHGSGSGYGYRSRFWSVSVRDTDKKCLSGGVHCPGASPVATVSSWILPVSRVSVFDVCVLTDWLIDWCLM